jgi:hypothetical protein
MAARLFNFVRAEASRCFAGGSTGGAPMLGASSTGGGMGASGGGTMPPLL